jgi:hypothetical protein
MLKYLFGGGKKQEPETFVSIPKHKRDMYVVFHKVTQVPIGIYDSLEKAREYGRKSTYCTCIIYKFMLNEACKYINDPVYEDK